MKWLLRSLIMMVVLTLAAACMQAQTCSTSVAQIISPTPGSTLVPNPTTGAIDFSWCNASADYFVIVESVPGAHDIFFAFTGGAGGGAGQNFLNLGPACASIGPSGCIPALGETIYFTLETVKNKQILGSFQYTFTAPGTPAPAAGTSISVGSASVTSSSATQNVTLTATVSAATTVNQGTVTFQVMNGASNVGAAVTSVALTNGSASVVYLLPAGMAAGSYTIQASYSGGANFLTSSGSGTLTVNAPPPVAAATSITVDPQNVAFSSAAQNVTLTAGVAAGSAVNEGTITFQVVDAGTNPIGTAATSATVTNGSASAVYALPAGLAAANYTIQAAYSGGTNFLASSNTGTLTVSAAPPPIQTATAVTVSNNAVIFSNNIQTISLSAAVSVPGGTVNEGTVTFQVLDGTTNIGTAVPSATLSTGVAIVSYDLPAGTPAKAYTIKADFSGSLNFAASSGTGTLTVNVTTPGVMLSPAAGSILASSTNFSWSPGVGVSQFFLYVGRSQGAADIYALGQGTNTSAQVLGLPTDGSTVFVRLWSLIGGNWLFTDSTYIASSFTKATITSPAAGSNLTSSSVNFTWSAGVGVSQYYLYVGKTLGGAEIYALGQGTSSSTTVFGIPTDGSTVFVRLWSLIGTTWQFSDASYTASSGSQAVITSPLTGSTLASSSATFTWNTGFNVSQYYLYVGKTLGGAEIYALDQGTNLSATVQGLPTDGSTLFVRLWSLIGGEWRFSDSTYIGASLNVAAITSPLSGSILTSSTPTFTWSAGAGATEYFLYIGKTLGGAEIYALSQGTSLSTTAFGLPTDGSTVFVRLWSLVGGNWKFSDSSYTAATCSGC